jgi:hypothetical protein
MDPDSRGPKICRSGSKSPTLELTNLDVLAVQEDFSRDLRAAEKSELAPPVLKNIRI